MPRIRLPYPHKGQQIVRRTAKRFNWLAAGRRWRKTTLLMTIAVEYAIAGQQIVWGAPTYDQVRIGWMETRRAAAGYAQFVQQRMMVEFPGGGRIIYRSLDDPDNARGHTADLVIVDEVGDVKPEAWYEVLRPMLMDTGGGAWLAGTPKGRNWFANEHARALDEDNSACWSAPVVGCAIVDGQLARRPHELENPFIPFEEITNLWRTMPERTFRQEVLAEFIEGEGAVFRNIAANLWLGGEGPADHEGHSLVMGVDWGQSEDFTVLSIGCATCRRELELDRFHGMPYPQQRERLAAKAGRWSVGYILAESNAMGQPNIEDLIMANLPVAGFETTASSKPPLIESLALSLEQCEVQWLDIPIATAELAAYERTVSEHTGRPRYSAPEGQHDDTVMARALCRKAMDSAGPWIYVIGG